MENDATIGDVRVCRSASETKQIHTNTSGVTYKQKCVRKRKIYFELTPETNISCRPSKFWPYCSLL